MTMEPQGSSRRAVASYAVGATDVEKRRALVGGLRDIAGELVELVMERSDLSWELEQLANEVEAGDV